MANEDVGLVVILTEAKQCSTCGLKISKFSEAIMPRDCCKAYDPPRRIFFHRKCWNGRIA